MFDESHPQFLHPATPEEFLPPLSNWTTLGGIVMVIAFVSAIALSAILKYKIAIKAPATIRPAGELRLVQSPIAGTIKSIEVESDRGVKKDEIVAYIDDGRLQTQKSQLQGNIGQLTAQLASVDAQIKAIGKQIAAEGDRSNRAIASASAELLRAQREFQDREITSAAEVKEAEANFRQAQKQLQQQRAELRSAEANLRSTAASWQAARKKRDRYQPLVESGSIALDQFEEVQLAVEQQAQATASQTALVEAQKQAIAQQERAIEAALARDTKHTRIAGYGDIVALKSEAHQKYVTASSSGSADANKDEIETDEEKFVIVRIGDTQLKDFVTQGDYIALKSVAHDTYLKIDGSDVKSNADSLEDSSAYWKVDSYTNNYGSSFGTSVTPNDTQAGGPCPQAACGEDTGGATICAVNACGTAACGAAAALIAGCGMAAIGIGICQADFAVVGACDAVACFAALGGIGVCGADVCGIAACGVAGCGAAACGAAACGADACGAAAAGMGGCGANACGGDAGGIDACPADACGANACGINACPADACAADVCAIDLIPIIPFI